MLENKQIDAEIKNNPEILENFNQVHGDILIELRGRF